jgi:hypothetical protein
MDTGDTDTLVRQLAAGFEALQDEYEKLFERHGALERKLATARDQVRTPHAYTSHPSFYDEHPFSSRSVAVRSGDRFHSN